MKIVTWNVNGIRGILKKDFINKINKINPDILCIQETKLKKCDEIVEIPQYLGYYNFTRITGYSGVAIFTKKKPVNVVRGIIVEDEENKKNNVDTESRVITIEYNDFYIVSVYIPSSQLRRP